jgi:hypothetical protein
VSVIFLHVVTEENSLKKVRNQVDFTSVK